MRAANKVMMNTGILYVQILVSMSISLYTVPLVLKALGASDYGLYSLVAGVITMLAFLNVAMTVSTQRFMSVALGEGRGNHLNSVYNSSIVLHFIIGLVVVALFELCGLFVFDHLNIDSSRIAVAQVVYQFLVASMFFTIMTVPFDAAMNAYEDMLAYSVVSIVESLLKLLLALSLSLVKLDRLPIYALGIAGISILVFLVKVIFVSRKYSSLKISGLNGFSRSLFREMFGFAGWNTFGAVAMIGRNQGLAIIINLFFGTILNASYGIANQVNGILSNFAVTLQKSINPQLMKSQGGNNQSRMLNIAFMSSKFSVLILSILAIPLIVEMPYILNLWLGNVPENSVIFTRLILCLSIVSQYSSGIMSAIQSVGRIKRYTIVMSGILLINLPVAYFLLKQGLPAYSVLIGIVLLEVIALFVRLIFAKYLVGLNGWLFVRKIVFPTLIILSVAFVLGSWFAESYPQSFFRLVLTSLICIAVFLIGSWTLVLSQSEKSVFYGVIHSMWRLLKK